MNIFAPRRIAVDRADPQTLLHLGVHPPGQVRRPPSLVGRPPEPTCQ